MEGRVMPKLRSDRERRGSRAYGVEARDGRVGGLDAAGPLPVLRAGAGADRVEILSRLQRHRRRAPAQRRRPCPRRPVGRGGRNLSAGDPAVRRQGRPAAQGRPGRATGRASRSSTSTSASFASVGSRRCRPRRGRSTAVASMPRPNAGIARGATDGRPRRAAAGRRAGVLQLVGRRCARPAGRPGLPGRPVRRGDRGLSPAGPGPIRRGRSGLVYPDPSVDLARVAAKKLLCRAALGDDPPTPGRAGGLRRGVSRAPKGSLAGRNGPLPRDPGRGASKRPISRRRPSPTAAGRRSPASPTRTKVVPGRSTSARSSGGSSCDAASAPSRIRLQPGCGAAGMAATTIRRADRLLAYHPIVLGDQVIVCDDERIVAYNLNDRPEGRPAVHRARSGPAWRHDQHAGDVVRRPPGCRAARPRYTLTAFGDRIYARLGRPARRCHTG